VSFLDGGLDQPKPEESDLDIGVVFLEFFPEKNREYYHGLLEGLSRLFTPFQVDLVYLEEERCQLQYEALKKGALVYACCERCSRAYHRRVLEAWGDWYNWWP
jgi:hypothetical protein